MVINTCPSCDVSAGYICKECSEEIMLQNMKEALVWAITELKLKDKEFSMDNVPAHVKRVLEWKLLDCS